MDVITCMYSTSKEISVIDSVYMCLVSYLMHIFIRIGGWINSHSCLYPMIIHVRLKPTVKYEYKYDIGYIRKKIGTYMVWMDSTYPYFTI